jgi:site-specific DNA-methyltransferase (adenine-specific)
MCIDMEIALHTKKKENEQVEKVLTFSDVSITKIESKDSITEQVLINGDCEEILFEINDNSIDFMATDPPYGLSFMGKNWDKVLPPTEIWRECYRVLKPGAFIAVMSSPRSDLLYRMIKDLEDAGFDMSFSPIMWTYHSGFPKASDTSKMIDKRGGDKYVEAMRFGEYIKQVRIQKGIGIAKIDKDLFDSSTQYSWYEGRPAGQYLPTTEAYVKIKEYLGLDDRFDFIFQLDETKVVGEIPMTFGIGSTQERQGDTKKITEPSTDLAKKYEGSKLGFQPKPAVEHIIIGMKPHESKSYIDNVLNFEALPDNIKITYPFIQVPKPTKTEKDFGLNGEEKKKNQRDEGQEKYNVPHKNRPTTSKNIHPTTKPVKLMSYIITLFTREGDWVIDPFLGSGTTGLSSKLLNRNFIGVEREKEYYDICAERLSVDRNELIKFFKK